MHARIHLRFMMFRCSTTRSSCSSGIRAFLSKVFPEQLVGQGGPTAWPARCPDLNPLDFYLWEYLKRTVYVTEVSDVQEWQQRIRNGLEMAVRHLEFSSQSGNRCSAIQSPAWKIKVDTSSSFSNRQEVVIGKPYFSRSHSLRSLSYDRSMASSKASSPQSAI